MQKRKVKNNLKLAVKNNTQMKIVNMMKENLTMIFIIQQKQKNQIVNKINKLNPKYISNHSLIIKIQILYMMDMILIVIEKIQKLIFQNKLFHLNIVSNKNNNNQLYHHI